MNVIARTIALVYFTVLVVLVFLHHPFEGYAFTTTRDPGTHLPKWVGSGPSCTAADKAMWENYYAWLRSPSENQKVIPTEQLIKLDSEAKAIGARCVVVEELSPPVENANSFLVWRSNGALVPWLATGTGLVAAIVSASVVAAAAFLLLARHRAA